MWGGALALHEGGERLDQHSLIAGTMQHSQEEQRELSPMEMLLAECGQPLEESTIPDMDDVLSRHVDMATVRQ